MLSWSQSSSRFPLPSDNYYGPDRGSITLEGRELESNTRYLLLLWLLITCPHPLLRTPKMIGHQEAYLLC